MDRSTQEALFHENSVVWDFITLYTTKKCSELYMHETQGDTSSKEHNIRLRCILIIRIYFTLPGTITLIGDKEDGLILSRNMILLLHIETEW